MTLERVRICMRDAAAAIAGIGYVAITRVKHIEHLVFEEDLPSWEAFQEAKRKPGFRQRRRMELRFLAKFSRTLRRYGFCEEDRWTPAESNVAQELLSVLRARGQKELRAARLERGKAHPTEDTWAWPPAGPDVAAEIAAAAAATVLRETFAAEAEPLLGVAEHLQTELHLPAVREALQCLIPEWLDPALDEKQRKGPRGDADRVGVKLSCEGWSVDVSVESVLRAGRRMDKVVLEFFLRALAQVCCVLELPLYVGTHHLGMHVGGPLPAEQLARLVSRWKQFGDEEQERVRRAHEVLLPVCEDPEGNRKSSDWVLLRLRATEAARALNKGSGLVVEVADRHRRPGLAKRVSAKLCGVLPLTRHRLLGTEPSFEVVECPDCEDGMDSILLVLGLLSARVAETAGLRPMAAATATYVQDVRLAAAEAFADLREKVDGELSADRDVVPHLLTAGACRAWLEKLVTKPAPPVRRTRQPATHARCSRGTSTPSCGRSPPRRPRTTARGPRRTTWRRSRLRCCAGSPTCSPCRSAAAPTASSASARSTASSGRSSATNLAQASCSSTRRRRSRREPSTLPACPASPPLFACVASTSPSWRCTSPTAWRRSPSAGGTCSGRWGSRRVGPPVSCSSAT